MQDGKRWIYYKGRRILVNANGYIEKKKEKKIDYQKYLDTRKNSIENFVATNGVLEYLSEKKANELYKMGMPEDLLPYTFPLKDDSSIKDINNYIKYAKQMKEADKEYQKDKIKSEQNNRNRENAENTINDLSKNYNGKSSKDYIDFEINSEAYKDNPEIYYDTLDEKTQNAIDGYTSQTGEYNFAYFNNILNEKWKGRHLDNEAKRRMQLIDNAINGSTITDNIYVYRNFDKMYIDKDGYICSKGYLSTSLYKGIAENYFDYPDIMKLRVPKGTNGLFIGANTMSKVAEFEVLFGRNTKIKVIGRNDDGTIECEIVR